MVKLSRVGGVDGVGLLDQGGSRSNALVRRLADLSGPGSVDLKALGIKNDTTARSQMIGISLGLMNAANDSARKVIESFGR